MMRNWLMKVCGKMLLWGGIRDHAGYEHSKTNAYSGGMKYYEEWGVCA